MSNSETRAKRIDDRGERSLTADLVSRFLRPGQSIVRRASGPVQLAEARRGLNAARGCARKGGNGRGARH